MTQSATEAPMKTDPLSFSVDLCYLCPSRRAASRQGICRGRGQEVAAFYVNRDRPGVRVMELAKVMTAISDFKLVLNFTMWGKSFWKVGSQRHLYDIDVGQIDLVEKPGR